MKVNFTKAKAALVKFTFMGVDFKVKKKKKKK